MDTLVDFDRKCTELYVRVKVLVAAYRVARDRGAPDYDLDELLTQRANLVQESLDYTLEHWNYLNEEAQVGWNELAAKLPLIREQERDENCEITDED